jgi:hypothetical protein
MTQQNGHLLNFGGRSEVGAAAHCGSHGDAVCTTVHLVGFEPELTVFGSEVKGWEMGACGNCWWRAGVVRVVLKGKRGRSCAGTKTREEAGLGWDGVS